ncbi:FecR family protein [Mucilaginibacter gracilis]|nr:FecR family protein [Mucilaginibacter gracilis]
MENQNDQQEQEFRHRLSRLNFTDGDLIEEQLKAEQLWSNQELRLLLKPRKIINIRRWMSAASIVLMLSAAFIFQYIRKEKADVTAAIAYGQIRTTKGERKTVILSDGSRVTMNSASVLKYPLDFIKKNREVELQGQAFFEVKHDSAHPFIIQTSKLAVQVLGTTFDVNNYENEQELAVTVSSGKVSVLAAKKAGYRILLPGDRLVYHPENGKLEMQKVQPDDYTSWQKGYYVFEDKNLSYICKQLEKTYNVEFFFQNPELKNKKMSFRIRGENITRVTGMLSLAGGFDYTIKGRKITLTHR